MKISINDDVWKEIRKNAPRPWSNDAVAVDLQVTAADVRESGRPVSLNSLFQRWGWQPTALDWLVANHPGEIAAINGLSPEPKPKPKPAAKPKKKSGWKSKKSAG